MRTRKLLVAMLAVAAFSVRATAVVNLELRPEFQQVSIGDVVEIGLYAVSSSDAGEAFSGLDVVLKWDPLFLELLKAVNDGPHAWSFIFGFPPDGALDGLNDTFLDGDALFQAASFGSATATPGGVLVATLRFLARNGSPDTQLVIESESGLSTKTTVFEPGGADVTGELGTTMISVLGSIPAVSEWGLLILALLVLTAGTVVIGRGQTVSPGARC